jgi:hypothetical protein
MQTPAEKPASKSAKKKEQSGEMDVREKKNYKLNAAVVQCIIDMTLNGSTANDTIKFLIAEYGIKVDIRTIYYHRRASRAKIMATMDEEISRARANIPELATLSGRLSGLQSTIEKERKKRRSSAMSLTAAYSAADMAMYHAEILRLRYRESLAKFPERRDDESERIMRELERRSHVMRDVTETEARIMKQAEDVFIASDPDKPIVVEGEVIENDVIDNPIPENPKGLGEDALIG